jgi:hypothetical protein
MSSDVAYLYLNVSPGATMNMFRHGYGDRQAVSYCTVVDDPTNPNIGGPISITQGDTYRHVDGTVARTWSVHNPTSSWFMVWVIETIDTF